MDRKPLEQAANDLINGRKVALINNLNGLRKAGITTDVIINCKDGQLYAHKCVLIGENEDKNLYFEAMFNSRMLESKTNIINYEYSTECVDIILSFIYAENVPDLTDRRPLLIEVIRASHLMQIGLLYNFYWTRWVDYLTPTSFAEVWNYADKFSENQTVIKALNYLWENYGYIQTDTIQNLQESQVIKFFEHFENQPATDNVVKCLLNWRMKNVDKRTGIVFELLSRVDLHSLTCGFIGQLLSGHLLDKFLSDFRERVINQAAVKLSFSPDYNIKIHYSAICDFSVETKINSYDTVKHEWTKTENIIMKTRYCACWQLLLTEKGEKFFCGISKNHKFIIYDPVNDKHHHGPRSNNLTVSGFVDGEEFYFRERNHFWAIFNYTTRKWKKIEVKMAGCGQTVLINKGKIYFNPLTKNEILVYDAQWFKWDRVIIKPEMNMLNVKCKCLSRNCEGKLYFVNETKLTVYNIQNAEWSETNVESMTNKIAIVSNCELDLVLFRDKITFSLWLFYVSSKKWLKLPPNIINMWQKSSFNFSFE